MHNHTPDATPTILADIVRARRTHLPDIAHRIRNIPEPQPSTRSLYHNLKAGGAFIMECKSASPSLGLIRADYNPSAIAQIYSQYAAGISVLCEPERFGGDYDHLAAVAATTHLPVLCKDFIIDPIQIRAARHYGADAILLMLSVLTDAEYRTLAAEAHRWNLDILTEVITETEVARAINLGANIFGINNRNLHDLSIDLTRTPTLARHVPDDAVIISESGIRNNATVRTLKPYVHGFLVGSQLTSQPNIDYAARELIYGTTKICGLTSPAAAQAARAAGATHGGLIFEQASPRAITATTARTIIAAEPGLKFVAVSRSTSPEEWAELAAIPGITALQIHSPYQGSTDAEHALIDTIRQATGNRAEIWRAVSMTGPTGTAGTANQPGESDQTGPASQAEAGQEWARAVADRVDKLVLDAGDGGSGTSFNWETIPAELAGKTLLAGGINPQNLAEALAAGTAGLDLNSGFEYAPGKKDTGALNSAFDIIRAYYPHDPRT